MVTGWSAEGDLAEVIDTLEPLSLKRRGCSAVEWTRASWRFSEQSIEAIPSAGAVRRTEVVWQIPAESGELPPQPGDLLIDANGRCMSVATVNRLQGETRYRCVARLAELRRDAVDRFDLEEAVFDQTPEGPVFAGWRTVRRALSGVAFADGGSVAKTPSTASKVVMIDQNGIIAGQRLQWSRGGVLEVVSLTLPGESGGPTVAVVKEATASSS